VLLISEGKALPFDQLLATEKTVGWFRALGRILGPKGLMPNDKQGTIVHDFATHGKTPAPAAKKMNKKGIEVKLQERGTKDSLLRIVVGKVANSPSCITRLGLLSRS
jgi:ribosomal protein L1